MKKLLRIIIVPLVLFFIWPFFIFRKYGNIKYRLTDKTIIICNHYSTFDAFFIYFAFWRKKINFVTITKVKKKLATRFFTWLFDCLYLDYESTNFGFFKQCIKILNSGGVIGIFPEGAVNPRKYGFIDFKQSFVYLARKTGAKILPLYIYPDLKLFGKTKLYIGEEYSVESYSSYKDMYDAATFFQCKIIDYSLTFEHNQFTDPESVPT